MKKLIHLSFAFSLSLFINNNVTAQCAGACNCVLVTGGGTTGNWDNPALWTSCGSSFPGSDDNVTIAIDECGLNRVDVNVSSACNNLTFVDNSDFCGSNSILRVLTGQSLTVNGTTTLVEGGGEGGSIITLIGTGTLALTGAVTFDGSCATATNCQISSANGASTVIVSNTMTLTGAARINGGSNGSTWDFNASVAQTIPLSVDQYYDHLTVNNTSAATLGGAVTTTSVKGNITIPSGGILDNGGFDIAGNASESFLLNSGGTFRVADGDAADFPSGFGTTTLSGTVEYSFAGAQTISDQTYTNLTLSGSGIKSLAAGSTISGDVIINGTADFGLATFSPTINGDWTNNTADNCINGTGTITFGGSAAQTISGAITDFDDVIITNTVGVKFGANDDASFVDVTINGSGILDPDAFDFDVTGNWTNNVGAAGFTPDIGSEVAFTGSAAQSIAGSGSTTFEDIDIASTATDPGVTFTTACNIHGILDVSDGQLDIGTALVTFTSDANGTGVTSNLDDETPNVAAILGTGSAIVQRFANESSPPSWYLMAAAVTGETIEEWDDDAYITGSGATWDASSSFTSVQYWDESACAYVEPATTAQSLNNDGTGLDESGWFVYENNNVTYDLTGALVEGTVAFGGLTRSGCGDPGWHMLGNPYQAHVDWTLVTLASITGNSAYVINTDGSGNYVTYDQVGTERIAAGEGFFVNASAGGASVTFDEADKILTSGSADDFNSVKIAGNQRLTIDMDVNSGSQLDYTEIFFDDNATKGNDVYMEPLKLANFLGKISIATQVDSVKLYANALPTGLDSIRIPIVFYRAFGPYSTTDNYTLTFSGINFADNICLSLEDSVLGTMTPIVADSQQYSFTMMDTDPNRIFLHINSPVTTIETAVACFGNSDGMAIAQGNGSGPFDYYWKNQAGDTIRTMLGITTADTLSALAGGQYSVIVTNNGSCGTIEAIVQINEPLTALATTNSTTAATCGSNNGTAVLSASGGNSGFTYAWPSGGTDSTETGLLAGTYSATVTDASGCSVTETVTVNGPSAPVSLSSSANDITCNGANDGMATISPSGGTAGYTFSWSSGGTDSTETGLAAGNYTVIVTDVNNCSDTASVTINEPAAISLTMNSNDATCGQSNGSANIAVAGGTGGYTYAWPSGGTDTTENNLAASAYTVTVTDANGCTETTVATISDVSGPTVSLASYTDAVCNGNADGAATVSISGGTPGFTYAWSSGGTDSTETGLTAGTYTFTVTDATGCMGVSSATINEPDAISITQSTTDISCNGSSDGTNTVSVTGGTSGYTYSWDNGDTDANISALSAGNYTVTITDTNSCTGTSSVTVTEPATLSLSTSTTDVTCNGNADGSATTSVSGGTSGYTYAWSTGGSGATELGLAAGIYSVTVTDNNGCTDNTTDTISELAAIVISTTTVDASCNGSLDGEVTATVSGGASGYTYLWSSGGTSATESNLAAGIYTVTVTDNLGCSSTATSIVNEPNGMAISTDKTDASCFGLADGAINLTVTGGSAPYTYSWSNGATDEDISSLTAATYSLTVTDNNGCSLSQTFTITQPTQTFASFTVSADTVYLGESVTFTNTSIGLTMHTWYFGDGSSFMSTNPTYTYNQSGTYSVTLVSSDGVCSDTAEIIIVVQPLTGIAEANRLSGINIYNVNNLVVIESENGNLKGAQINVYNVLGQQIIAPVNAANKNSRVEIHLPEASGIYFVEVNSDNYQITRKINF
ncbi:MAG: hypothetical protein COA57_08535 [Flavobacteriales bacterium]|nr:MAG: hypothetical protein COA57_08535 [Flavobacteriales bacterium]